MTFRSSLQRLAVLALATALLGLAFAALLSAGAADAAVRGVSSGCARCSNLAGYTFESPEADYGPSQFTETSTFVVPRLRCGSADRAVLASFGGYVGKAGRPQAAALFIGCDGGKAHYWPQLTANGSIENYRTKTAHPGDKIVLRLAFSRKSSSVSVTDQTHKFKVTRAGGAGGSLYEWIGDEPWARSPYHLERVPDFGTLTYSNTKVHGHALGSSASSSTLARNDLGTPRGTLQVKTGPLSSDGKAFSTYFKHH